MATLLPGLVFDYAGDEQCTTLYSLSDGAHHPCELVDALRGKRIWVTSQDWVLAWDPATLASFLWSPHDDAKMVLPSLAQAPPVGTSCAMSGKPTDPGGCTVVILEEPDSTALWYCHAGGSSEAAEWVRHEYDLGGTWVPDEGGKIWAPKIIPELAACRGKFYTLLSSGECVVLEFSPEPFLTTVTLAKPVKITVLPGEYMATAFIYPLNLDGDFHTVWIFFSGRDGTTVVDVAVNRMDLTSKGAIRVDSIGDRAIVVGGSNGSLASWCPASEFGLLPNSVYWMNNHDGRSYVYDIGVNTEEVHEP